MEVKVCDKCEVEKPVGKFYFRKDSGKYQNKCKECTLIKSAKYREDNRDIIRERDKKHYVENTEKFKIKHKKQRENRDEEKWREYINKYRRDRRKNDPEFKLACLLRDRLYQALKGNYKSGSAVDDLGCSVAELKRHLQNQFYYHPKTGELMSWENHGVKGWHIDHIIPITAFNLSNAKELKKACNYNNLQPLWMEENIAKGNKN